MTQPGEQNLFFIVPTIGRDAALAGLLESLMSDLKEGDEVVVVAQGRHESIHRVCETFSQFPARLVIGTSRRGVSAGRNAGIRCLSGQNGLILFPNDTTRFPRGAVARLRGLPKDFTFGAQAVFDDLGPKLDLPNPGSPLDSRSVWKAMSVGLVIRREFFDRVGDFDENLGTGASSHWQAGEETDWLLRAVALGFGPTFQWLPSSYFLEGVRVSHGLDTPSRRRKLRAYGRGIGYVYRRWAYPRRSKARLLLGSLAVGFRSKGAFKQLDAPWALLGRIEGLLGKTFMGASLPVSNHEPESSSVARAARSLDSEW